MTAKNDTQVILRIPKAMKAEMRGAAARAGYLSLSEYVRDLFAKREVYEAHALALAELHRDATE